MPQRAKSFVQLDQSGLLLGRQTKCKAVGKTIPIPPVSLIEHLRLNPVKLSQVMIKHDAMPTYRKNSLFKGNLR